MARSPKALLRRRLARQRPARERPIVSADPRAGQRGVRVDGDGVRGAVGVLVAGDHLGEVERGAEAGRDGRAD